MDWDPWKADDQKGLADVFEPIPHERLAQALTSPAGDWLCALCLNHVANEKDRFPFDGKTEFSFLNPAGIRFEIISFARALSCLQSGTPTLEHTWFPEHSWSFCLCQRCGYHLGWFYSGEHQFVGLIRDHLVRGLCVRN